jgi:tRNA pseudouridine55 synthase
MSDPKPMAQAKMRWTKRPVHGVLLVDKIVGPSSHAVLGRARRLWQAEKGGHTGTLDPLASGLLPICFGAATKFAQVCLDADKAYRATVHLGQIRVGGDLEGAVLTERPVGATLADVRKVIARCVGEIDQTPPMHSALKHDGKPLYALARAGIEVARASRRVTIHSVDIVRYEAPRLIIDVRCSKGTYIRVLAEDIGAALGCGAHLAGLQRTGTGGFGLSQAIRLDDAEALSLADRDAHLLPVDTLVADWPAITLAADDAGRFLTGLRRRVDHPDATKLRVYGPARSVVAAQVSMARGVSDLDLAGFPPRQGPFLGTAHVVAGELIADRLLSPLEIDSMVKNPLQPIDLH